MTRPKLKAILSDIHGNLEALNAVLSDIADQRVDSIDNLGDITGYGPDPIACIDLSMSMSTVLKSNFDSAVVPGGEVEGFGVYAQQSLIWTRKLLESRSDLKETRWDRIDFLKGQPIIYSEYGVLFVHGSPLAPFFRTIYPEDIHHKTMMESIGQQIDHVCFNGGSHTPGIFVDSGSMGWQFLTPEECGGEFRIDERKVLCHVGSVGQPRDGDWRASYVLFDGQTISFRRVAYDVETTIAKIYAISELGNFSGDRLRKGR